KLAALATETVASVHTCDAVDPASVDRLFAEVDRAFPKLDVCLFNASARAPGPITDVDRDQARTALLISSYGGFLVAQAAARRMLPHGSGTILLTGASASMKGYRSRPCSRWANSPCAAWPNRWPGSWHPRASMSRTLSSMAACAMPRKAASKQTTWLPTATSI